MSANQKYLIQALEICLIIFFIWFTFYGGYLIGSHFDKGWYLSEDGYNFIESARLFKDNGLNVFIKSELARQASLNYIFTIILISFLIEFKSWAYIFLSINLTLYLLSYYILKNFLKKITKKVNFFYLNIILILFYFSNYENYFYVRLILSDCIFAFFVLFMFIKFNEKSNLSNNFMVITSFLLIFFINPKFIAILFFLIFYYFIKFLIIDNKFINKDFFATTIFFSYLVGLLIWSILYPNLNFIDFFKGDIFREIENFYLDGTVIFKRTNIDYLPNDINIIKIFYLGILRSFSFFQFWSFEWDLKHNIVNLISIGPLYLANIFNIYNFNKYSKNDKKIIICITSIIIAFTFMSSITGVDYDWRYRYPLYSILIIGLMIFIKEKIKR